MSKNDVIVVNDVKELEKLDKKDRVVIEDMTGKNRGDLIEYIKDEKKFLEVLYLLNEKEDIEKLIKMRLISGKNLPLKDILLRSKKTSIDGSFRYKEYEGLNDENYIQSPMIHEEEFKISKILDKVNEGKGSFLNSMIDGSLTNYNVFLFEKTGELYFYGIYDEYRNLLYKVPYDFDLKKDIENLLKKEKEDSEAFIACSGYTAYTFVIEIEDNPKLIEAITDAVYERNQKEREARNYFNI